MCLLCVNKTCCQLSNAPMNIKAGPNGLLYKAKFSVYIGLLDFLNIFPTIYLLCTQYHKYQRPQPVILFIVHWYRNLVSYCIDWLPLPQTMRSSKCVVNQQMKRTGLYGVVGLYQICYTKSCPLEPSSLWSWHHTKSSKLFRASFNEQPQGFVAQIK